MNTPNSKELFSAMFTMRLPNLGIVLIIKTLIQNHTTNYIIPSPVKILIISAPNTLYYKNPAKPCADGRRKPSGDRSQPLLVISAIQYASTPDDADTSQSSSSSTAGYYANPKYQSRSVQLRLREKTDWPFKGSCFLEPPKMSGKSGKPPEEWGYAVDHGPVAPVPKTAVSTERSYYWFSMRFETLYFFV